MSLPIQTALWYAITGNPNMDFIHQNGKLYVSVDGAADVVRKYRLKLMRLGLLRMPGLTGCMVVELFDILAKQIDLLNKLKDTLPIRSVKEYPIASPPPPRSLK